MANAMPDPLFINLKSLALKARSPLFGAAVGSSRNGFLMGSVAVMPAA